MLRRVAPRMLLFLFPHFITNPTHMGQKGPCMLVYPHWLYYVKHSPNSTLNVTFWPTNISFSNLLPVVNLEEPVCKAPKVANVTDDDTDEVYSLGHCHREWFVFKLSGQRWCNMRGEITRYLQFVADGFFTDRIGDICRLLVFPHDVSCNTSHCQPSNSSWLWQYWDAIDDVVDELKLTCQRWEIFMTLLW